MTFALLLVAFGITLALTAVLRGYALHHRLLDVPGQRSSHRQVTPRGGGLAIVLVTFLGTAYLAVSHTVAPDVWAVLGPAFLVAWVGWRDDHSHVSARYRFSVHGACSALMVFLLWPLELSLVGFTLPGMMLAVLLTLWLAWSINLFNFMDGINGIASIEAASVLGNMALLMFLSGQPVHVWFFFALVATCSLGFLVWNFPRARIFMGDVGSGFLGSLIGGLSILALVQAEVYFWALLILYGVFVADSTVTLIRRALHGEKVYQAHRSHAYQHTAQRLGSHTPVTLAVLAINLLWLLPWAWLVVSGLFSGFLALLMAYAPIVALVWRLGAGRRSKIAS